MEKLFGLSMNVIMVVLLAIVVPALAAVALMAWRNRVMLKIGLRNIPRRRAQTALIVIGIMLSTVIMAAAFGTGDTINFSIRNEAIKLLGPIDEIIVSTETSSEDTFGTPSYVPEETFQRLLEELGPLEGDIDGVAPGVGQTVPAVNLANLKSEGRMRVAGVDPDHLSGFRLVATSGETVTLRGLPPEEGYINDKAAEDLEAAPGDDIRIVLEGGSVTFRVRGVVDRGGLAGDQATLLVPLDRAQELFDREGQINSIVVSNRGDAESGVELSGDVSQRMRAIFASRDVAGELLALLSQAPALEAIQQRSEGLRGNKKADMDRLAAALQEGRVTDDLVGLLSDGEVSDEVLGALDQPELAQVQTEADTLFGDLADFEVLEIKQTVMEQAELVSSFITTFFIILGLFSILVGVLLIFLIFVMLAAARRTEMGMARALGAKRRHLVQMFVFEGTAYAVASAAIGVVIGLAVSALIIQVVNQIIGTSEVDFTLTRHFEPRSIVIAYCLGMAITLITIAASAYRVSRMNIVAAIRDLPPPERRDGTPWSRVLSAPLVAAVQPVRSVGGALKALATLHPMDAAGLLLRAGRLALAVPGVALGSLFQVFWRPFKQGWLAFLLGVLLAWIGMQTDQASSFRIGVSLMIVGAGLTARSLLLRTAMRAEVRDRIAYTGIGLAMLVFWVLPFSVLRTVSGELTGGPEMFFVSGISMVAAAVWTVMYNADLILKALTLATGRVGRLRPVLVTAVAYPMSAKFRTGLTLSMFALVIFTLIVMSILTNVFDVSEVDRDAVTGGWDIEGEVNPVTPIGDMRQAIDEAPGLQPDDFEAIGGFTSIPIEARQVGASEQRWRWYGARAADDAFLESTRYDLKLIARGYGPTAEGVWAALRDDPTLAVVDSTAVPWRSEFGPATTVPFQMEGFFYEDETFDATEIEARDPATGQVVPFTVIGVLDQLSDSYGQLGIGMITSKATLDAAIPFPVPITTYRFRLAPGVDASDAADGLDAAFPEQGMEARVLNEVIEDSAAAQRAFNHLFTGFMGLGLLVGIASLGVISLRAVVERRQQIGVLRAIGYRRWMVELSFLLESSFVALLGTAIGVGLGTIISYNIVNDVREQEGVQTLRFSIPWLQIIAIIAVAYVFSLLTTLLPARQASSIYPAEALRYE
ncbi:MAG: FtsX-like permease family protein [Dehalococcoidia bacterium]|nr:FtsX-like permease family protein [Dehalococcoidia bacterium]